MLTKKGREKKVNKKNSLKKLKNKKYFFSKNFQ